MPSGRGNTGLLSPGDNGEVVPYASVLNASSFRELIAAAHELR